MESIYFALWKIWKKKIFFFIQANCESNKTINKKFKVTASRKIYGWYIFSTLTSVSLKVNFGPWFHKPQWKIHQGALGYFSVHYCIICIIGKWDSRSLFSLTVSANEHLRKWEGWELYDSTDMSGCDLCALTSIKRCLRNLTHIQTRKGQSSKAPPIAIE